MSDDRRQHHTSPDGRSPNVALRDDKVRHLATLANGLSPETLDTITTMLERARTLEGLT